MNHRANPGRLLMHRLGRPTFPALRTPWVWAGLLFAGMVMQFSYHRWEFLDTPYLLYLAKTLDFRGIVINGFTADVEYRPLFRVGVDLIYGIVGANVTVFKAIIVVQFAGVLWCLVALFRVSTGYQALAACLALSCFVGLHTSSILLSFFPLSHHSFALLGLLATAVLCMRAHRSWFPACYFAVCLVLPFTIELGLLLPPMLVSLWWAGAPGVQRRDVAWGVGGVALYVIVRATFSSAGVDVPLLYTESGFGFGQIDPDEFSDAFGRAPYLFWVYNVMAKSHDGAVLRAARGDVRVHPLPERGHHATLAVDSNRDVAGHHERRHRRAHPPAPRGAPAPTSGAWMRPAAEQFPARLSLRA